MARMKFLCDAERCIECNGCVTACKHEHEMPWGVNRRRVVTLNDGVPGEKSISVACMHCSDAPCMAVCPVDCFYKTSKAWCCTTRTCASAAATASMPVRSARRSSRRTARSACAARWTSARSAPADPRPTIRGGVQEIRPQPAGGRQAAGVCRNVLDQGAAGRRRRRHRGHLSQPGARARQGRGGLGLGHCLWQARGNRRNREANHEKAGADRNRGGIAAAGGGVRRETRSEDLQAGRIPGQDRTPSRGATHSSRATRRPGKKRSRPATRARTSTCGSATDRKEEVSCPTSA